jgi:hypothetical protein
MAWRLAWRSLLLRLVRDPFDRRHLLCGCSRTREGLNKSTDHAANSLR